MSNSSHQFLHDSHSPLLFQSLHLLLPILILPSTTTVPRRYRLTPLEYSKTRLVHLLVHSQLYVLQITRQGARSVGIQLVLVFWGGGGVTLSVGGEFGAVNGGNEVFFFCVVDVTANADIDGIFVQGYSADVGDGCVEEGVFLREGLTVCVCGEIEIEGKVSE